MTWIKKKKVQMRFHPSKTGRENERAPTDITDLDTVERHSGRQHGLRVPGLSQQLKDFDDEDSMLGGCEV